MSDEFRDNPDETAPDFETAPAKDTESPERPRWWLRNPASGVAAAVAIGAGGLWVIGAIGPPVQGHGATLIYMVSLPMALLLPAGAVIAMLLAWSALQATHGKVKLLLAAPAAVALILNALAIGLFLRFVLQMFRH